MQLKIDTRALRELLTKIRDRAPAVLDESLNDAAAILLARAFSKIPQADPNRIVANLRRPVGKQTGQKISPWANTLAAAILAKQRRLQGKPKLPASEFFREVERDILRRTQNVGITRAALQPAAAAIGANLAFKRKFQKPLGAVKITQTPKPIIEITVWARAIQATAPNALAEGLKDSQYHLQNRIPRLLTIGL